MLGTSSLLKFGEIRRISVCDQGAQEVRIGDRSMASVVERLNQLQAWTSIALDVAQIMDM